MLWHEALTNQVCVILWINWRSPATFLLVLYKQTLLIRRSLLKEEALKIKCFVCQCTIVFQSLANSTSLVFLLYRLVSAWNNVLNVLITFLVYLSKHTSAVKYPKWNQWSDTWWTGHQFCTLPSLPLRHYYMMLLAFDTPSSNNSQEDAFCFPIESTE